MIAGRLVSDPRFAGDFGKRGPLDSLDLDHRSVRKWADGVAFVDDLSQFGSGKPCGSMFDAHRVDFGWHSDSVAGDFGPRLLMQSVIASRGLFCRDDVWHTYSFSYSPGFMVCWRICLVTRSSVDDHSLRVSRMASRTSLASCS